MPNVVSTIIMLTLVIDILAGPGGFMGGTMVPLVGNGWLELLKVEHS
jgi:hypothetical protein